MRQPIYTYPNWALITTVFPEGTNNGLEYIVFLDSSSDSYRTRLIKLKRVSPYLGAILEGLESTNVIRFIRAF